MSTCRARAHPARLLALTFFGGCVVLFVIAIRTRPDVAAFPVLAGVIGLLTWGALPDAAVMTQRDTLRRRKAFREAATSEASKPDAIAVLRRHQAELDLTDDEVAPDIEAIERWQRERRRASFIRAFVREFPNAKRETLMSLLWQAGNPDAPDHVAPEHIAAVRAAIKTHDLCNEIVSAGGLPVVADPTGVSGREKTHSVAGVLFDKRGPNDEHGELVFTDGRLVFNGSKIASVQWPKVAFVKRDGLRLLVQREDRQTPWVFCFEDLEGTAVAELTARWLIGDRDARFAADASLMQVPSVGTAVVFKEDLARTGNDRRGAEALKAVLGLGLGTLMLAASIPVALAPPKIESRVPVKTSGVPLPEEATLNYAIRGTPPNVVFVLVSPGQAQDDTELWRIARRIHPDNLPPTQVMFWADPATVPTAALPLSAEQMKQRVATISFAGFLGDRLVRATRRGAKATQ